MTNPIKKANKAAKKSNNYQTKTSKKTYVKGSKKLDKVKAKRASLKKTAEGTRAQAMAYAEAKGMKLVKK